MVVVVRRLIQHAIAGIGMSAGMATLAVGVLGSPANGEVTIAVPAPFVVTSVIPSPAPVAPKTAAQKAVPPRAQQISAGAAVADLASKREQTLVKQTKAITTQHNKLQEAAKKAEKAAKAAEAARQRAIQNSGYQPGVTDPREMARQILKNKYSLGDEHYTCFNNIIMRESNWDIDATNPSSGAYGIPQALPGSKMSTVGADWRTNPATQITWAVEYMKKRYGSPCDAWSFKRSHGWY